MLKRQLIVPLVLLWLATLACNLTSGGDVKNTPAPQETASLDVQADLTERLAAGTETWEQATGQSVLTVGDGIRTNANGTASITYFTGDLTELSPNTEMSIEYVEQSTGQISLNLLGGEIRNVVQRAMDADNRFEITTPAADAVVRGTIFKVKVDRTSGQTTIQVEDGRVEVSGQQGAPVSVPAGFEVVVDQGQAPQPPRPLPTPTPSVTPTRGTATTVSVQSPVFVPSATTTARPNNALLTIISPNSDQVLQTNSTLRVTGNARGFSDTIQVSLLDASGNSLATASTQVTANDPNVLVPWNVDLAVNFRSNTTGRVVASGGGTSAGVRVQLGGNAPTIPTATPAPSVTPAPSLTTAPTVTFTPTATLTTAPQVSQPFIRITSPVSGTDVDIFGFTVSGEAGGIFENTIVVQALDAAGNVVQQQVVTYRSAEVGGSGSWQAFMQPDTQPGTGGAIYAYATSARDGSVIAEARISVNYQISR